MTNNLGTFCQGDPTHRGVTAYALSKSRMRQCAEHLLSEGRLSRNERAELEAYHSCELRSPELSSSTQAELRRIDLILP